MNILAIDTSSQAASCAILTGDKLLGEFFIHTAHTHSQTILPMVQALLGSVELSVQDMDLFAVSTGPGSFTGLRIGISAVKGMAMAVDKPCVAVSTLEALAENLGTKPGHILPVMDARRSQFYTALFHCAEGQVQRLREDTALSVTQIGELIEHKLYGNAVTLVGDGASLCAQQLAHLESIIVTQENFRHQRAGSVARVAARLASQGHLCSAAELAPSYLRLPQAERECLAKLQIPEQ